MSRPEFLKRENRKPLSSKDIELMRLNEKYKEQFGDYPTTEPSPYSTTEWIDILSKCIEKNITVFELLPGELEESDFDDEALHIIVKDN